MASRSSGKQFRIRRPAAARRLLVAVLLAAAGAAGIIPWQAAERGAPTSSHDTLPRETRVQRVIDGDTVELSGGEMVRYIGIDTPESRRRRGKRWVNDPEPFAREATEANRRLVEGRTLRLEFDVQPRDKYGRSLAYVYARGEDGHELMVNAELLRQGMAQPMTIPPNVKFAEEFRDIAAEARQAKRGLWKLK